MPVTVPSLKEGPSGPCRSAGSSAGGALWLSLEPMVGAERRLPLGSAWHKLGPSPQLLSAPLVWGTWQL